MATGIRSIVMAMAFLAIGASAHARTFQMPGLGQDIHFEKNALTICAIGNARSCTTSAVAAADVVPLDDLWFMVIIDAHNYYSCTANYCEPRSTSDAERGWKAQGGFNLNDACFYDAVEGLHCTQAEPFRSASQLLIADFLGIGGKPQVLSLSQGLLCDTDGGPCRTTRGLGVLGSATHIAALVSPSRANAGLLANDAGLQTACRKFTFNDSTADFSCFQAVANDAPDLEPWVAGSAVFYVPKATATPIANLDANGNPRATDLVSLANKLDLSFGALNYSSIGALYEPLREPIEMFAIDVPAMTASPPPVGTPGDGTWTLQPGSSEGIGYTGTYGQNICAGASNCVQSDQCNAVHTGADFVHVWKQNGGCVPATTTTTADARAQGVTANAIQITSGVPYTFRWFSDQVSGKWPTIARYEECIQTAGASGPTCGRSDNRDAAAADIINRFCSAGSVCAWVGSWRLVDSSTGVFTIQAAPGFNPTNPPTQDFPSYSVVTSVPMTRDQCFSTCGRIATVQSNYCSITTAQIAGVAVGASVIAGVVAGVGFTYAAGPVAGVGAGVRVGAIFGTAVGGTAYGFDKACDSLNRWRQNQCLQITCGG